jgi:hypothetical protein
MRDMFAAVRAEALFVSSLQGSSSPSADEVRDAVKVTLRRFGMRGCAAHVAGEFGEHPETAVRRMGWALATVGTVYPSRSTAIRSASAVPALRLAG